MEDRIEADFREFHRRNPGVLLILERLAREWFSAGNRRVAIGMLWEVLRWQYNRITQDPSSTFKVNDHYHSRYVRLLLDLHPEWAEAFHTRALRAA